MSQNTTEKMHQVRLRHQRNTYMRTKTQRHTVAWPAGSGGWCARGPRRATTLFRTLFRVTGVMVNMPTLWPVFVANCYPLECVSFEANTYRNSLNCNRYLGSPPSIIGWPMTKMKIETYWEPKSCWYLFTYLCKYALFQYTKVIPWL